MNKVDKVKPKTFTINIDIHINAASPQEAYNRICNILNCAENDDIEYTTNTYYETSMTEPKDTEELFS